MTKNSEAIVLLCSRLRETEGAAPLEPKEWGELAKKLAEKQLQPSDLFDMDKNELISRLSLLPEYAERIISLIERGANIGFELNRLNDAGVFVITRADAEYPQKLRKTLGSNCPPVFYASGDVSLLSKKYIGYVGSRNANDADTDFTEKTVAKTAERGYGVVSGGARGVDTAAFEAAFHRGAPSVGYLSDSLLKKLREPEITRAVRSGKLLLLSAVRPDAGFTVGAAMMRNRFIYAQSSGTVVVRSDYMKGGTWAGACENLKYGWCKTLCFDKKSYKGNQALIESGAIPIDESWDGDPESAVHAAGNVQITMFD